MAPKSNKKTKKKGKKGDRSPLHRPESPLETRVPDKTEIKVQLQQGFLKSKIVIDVKTPSNRTPPGSTRSRRRRSTSNRRQHSTRHHSQADENRSNNRNEENNRRLQVLEAARARLTTASDNVNHLERVLQIAREEEEGAVIVQATTQIHEFERQLQEAQHEEGDAEKALLEAERAVSEAQ